MRRRSLLSLVAGATAEWCLPALALNNPSRIAFLGAATASSWSRQIDALRSGLRDLGYVEGKNIVIEYRWAEGNDRRLPELAAELIAGKIDVLVTHGTPGTRAAKRATTEVPIVMAISGDAIATGLVPSLGRPAGNITGSTFFLPELNAKRLEILKEAMPITRLAVLVDPQNPVGEPIVEALQKASGALGVRLDLVDVAGTNGLEQAVSGLAPGTVDAVALTQDGHFRALCRSLRMCCCRSVWPQSVRRNLQMQAG